MPSTSLLVAVASMTSQFVTSCLVFFCFLLRRMATGARKTKKLPLNAVSPSLALSKYMLILNTVSILVTNALLKYGGQPIIEVGLLWIPHSVEAGLFVSNVFGNASLSRWCFLKQFCSVRLFLTRLSVGRFHSMYQIVTSFARCMCVFSIARCIICLLSQALHSVL